MAYRRARPSRRRGRSFRGSSPRRTVWIRTFPAGAGLTAGGHVGLDLVPDTALDPGARIGATVERIRLRLQWQTGATITMGADGYATSGVVLGSFAGSAGTPNPVADADWMAWNPVPLSGWDGALVAAGAVTSPYLQSTTIDVRSKRVFTQPTDQLWLSFGANYDCGAIVAASSVLIKLA